MLGGGDGAGITRMGAAVVGLGFLPKQRKRIVPTIVGVFDAIDVVGVSV